MGDSSEEARVALVHDYLLVLRGAERTFAEMTDLWSEAPVFTTLYSRSGTGGRFADRRVVTSPLQRLGVGQHGFRRLLPLYPWAVGRLDTRPFDLVVSSSSAFAHGVALGPGAVHVCYCHSPFRYVWSERRRALTEVPWAVRPALAAAQVAIRHWDKRAAGRVTHYVANSRFIQERIAANYSREATVIYPPVATERFGLAEPEDFFLTVGEVVGHKRLEVALAAADRSGARMKVVGTGPELERLSALYGHVADFLGRVDDAELAALYARARALVVPNVEEFGIAAVEAQAAGRPVLALGVGGAAETVLSGITGVLVPNGTVAEFAEAMRAVDFEAFDGEAIAAHAATFGRTRFADQLRTEVERVVGSR